MFQLNATRFITRYSFFCKVLCKRANKTKTSRFPAKMYLIKCTRFFFLHNLYINKAIVKINQNKNENIQNDINNKFYTI